MQDGVEGPAEQAVDPRTLDAGELDAYIASCRTWVDEAEPAIRVEALRALGACLCVRYERTGSDDDSQEARRSLETALEASSEDSEAREWCAHSLAVLGTTLLRAYVRIHRAAELDAAVAVLTTATNAGAPGSLAAAGYATDLANALVQRFQRTQLEGDMVAAVLASSLLEQAVSLLHGALGPSKARPELHQAVLGSLGQALVVQCRDVLKHRSVDERAVAEAAPYVEEALRHFTEAVGASPPDSLDRVIVLTDLGNALSLKHEVDGDLDALDSAIERLEESRALGVALGAETAPVLGALAAAHGVRLDTARGSSADFDAALVAYRQGIERCHERDPGGALGLALRWGDWALRRAAWTPAIEAYTSGLRAIERLLSEQPLDADRNVTLRVAQQVGRHAAYAAAMSGDARHAVVLLEQGRNLRIGARNLVFEDVVARAQHAPLVYVVPTSVGGVGLVLRTDGDVRTIVLPQLADDELERHLGPYWASHRFAAADPDRQTYVVGSEGIEDADPRMFAIDELTAWLWHAAVRPLLAAATPDQEVTLIPTGGLAIAPLHAAWRPDPSRPIGRHYAMDEVTVSYAPSARALVGAEAALVAAGTGGLAVIHPAPISGPALPDTGVEPDLPPDVEVLRGTSATRDAVVAGMAGRRIVHFSTHAYADEDDPLRGGLLLAHDEVLTIGDLMALRLDAVRLAVLGACETAWSYTQLPEESVGLPSAFLLAGAAGVVGSLWRVPAVATSLLVAKFYARWAAHPSTPASALREAQQWLRDTTNAEKRLEFRGVADLEPPSGATSRRLWESARSYADPYFWAGFVYVGR